MIARNRFLVPIDSPGNSTQADDSYQRFFERNPLPMWIYDLESLAFVAVNEAAVEHYGYSRDEFLAMTIADIRPSEDLPDLLENVSAVTEGLDHAGVWRHLKKDGVLIYVEITSSAMEFAGRRAELVLAYDVTKRIEAEHALRRRLGLESTIAEISAGFVAPTDLDAAIDYALERMGIFSGASRAYLFQFHLKQGTTDNTHEWCAAGVNAEIAALQGLSMDYFPWSISRLRHGEIVPIPDVSTLPPAAASERIELERQGIKSLVLVPVQVGSTVEGFIGFDNIEAAEPWGDMDLALLRVAAELIGTALKGQRTEQALRTQKKNLQSFMQSAVGFAVYRLAVLPGDPYKGRVEFASPSMREILGVDPGDVFSRWFQRIHPADLPRVSEINRRAALNGKSFDTVMRIFHPDKKEWRWIRAVSNPVLDDSGRPTHFNGLMLDVTERVKTSLALKEERDFATAVMETVGALVVVIDPDGRIVRFNRACEQATGYAYAQVQGRRVLDFLIPPAECTALRRAFRGFREGRYPSHYENHWVALDGTQRLIAWSNTAMLDDRGQLEYGISTGIDITERKQAELALRKFHNAVEQSASGVIIINRQGEIEYINPRYAEIADRSEAELVGKPAWFLGHPNTAIDSQAKIWRILLGGENWRGEFKDHKPDGRNNWSLVSISPILDPQGNPSHFVAVVEDVTALKEAHEEMRRLASYDALTGLPNRRLFRDRLQQALKTAARHRQMLALLYLDLDNFKRVNDSLGHDAGDELLQTVAQRLQVCVRQEDTVARLGGDEFVVLLSNIHGNSGVNAVAAKILDALRRPMRVANQEVVVTASIGITVVPDDGLDSAGLLRNADLAMYRAKETGRDCYEFFQTELNREVSHRLSLEAELRRALERDELVLYFQPIVRVKDLKIVGFEALVRWQHPERGLVPPNQFIPVAEESGLIVPIGQRLLHLATDQIHCLRTGRDDPLPYVAVNLSVREFRNERLADNIDNLLGRSSLAPQALVLEITESMLMDDVRRVSALLERLREIGVRISVDDFGTGYSSLSYLKRLPVDNLKVDRSFVRDIPADKSDMEIAAAIIAMAHKLELAVVAEGLETQEQLAFLQKNGCDLAQGFLFGGPVPAEELMALPALGCPLNSKRNH